MNSHVIYWYTQKNNTDEIICVIFVNEQNGDAYLLVPIYTSMIPDIYGTLHW